MFTMEEIILLDSYKETNLNTTIKNIRSNYKHQEDKEIINLIDGLLLKLEKISKNDY